MTTFKQVIVIREDAGLTAGEVASVAAQTATDAAAGRLRKAHVEGGFDEAFGALCGSEPIVVTARDADQIGDLLGQVKVAGLPKWVGFGRLKPIAGVRDEASIGAIAVTIGPGPAADIDRITGSLPAYPGHEQWDLEDKARWYDRLANAVAGQADDHPMPPGITSALQCLDRLWAAKVSAEHRDRLGADELARVQQELRASRRTIQDLIVEVFAEDTSVDMVAASTNDAIRRIKELRLADKQLDKANDRVRKLIADNERLLDALLGDWNDDEDDEQPPAVDRAIDEIAVWRGRLTEARAHGEKNGTETMRLLSAIYGADHEAMFADDIAASVARANRQRIYGERDTTCQRAERLAGWYDRLSHRLMGKEGAGYEVPFDTARNKVDKLLLRHSSLDGQLTDLRATASQYEQLVAAVWDDDLTDGQPAAGETLARARIQAKDAAAAHLHHADAKDAERRYTQLRGAVMGDDGDNRQILGHSMAVAIARGHRQRLDSLVRAVVGSDKPSRSQTNAAVAIAGRLRRQANHLRQLLVDIEGFVAPSEWPEGSDPVEAAGYDRACTELRDVIAGRPVKPNGQSGTAKAVTDWIIAQYPKAENFPPSAPISCRITWTKVGGPGFATTHKQKPSPITAIFATKANPAFTSGGHPWNLTTIDEPTTPADTTDAIRAALDEASHWAEPAGPEGVAAQEFCSGQARITWQQGWHSGRRHALLYLRMALGAGRSAADPVAPVRAEIDSLLGMRGPLGGTEARRFGWRAGVWLVCDRVDAAIAGQPWQPIPTPPAPEETVVESLVRGALRELTAHAGTMPVPERWRAEEAAWRRGWGVGSDRCYTEIYQALPGESGEVAMAGRVREAAARVAAFRAPNPPPQHPGPVEGTAWRAGWRAARYEVTVRVGKALARAADDQAGALDPLARNLLTAIADGRTSPIWASLLDPPRWLLEVKPQPPGTSRGPNYSGNLRWSNVEALQKAGLVRIAWTETGPAAVFATAAGRAALAATENTSP